MSGTSPVNVKVFSRWLGESLEEDRPLWPKGALSGLRVWSGTPGSHSWMDTGQQEGEADVLSGACFLTIEFWLCYVSKRRP